MRKIMILALAIVSFISCEDDSNEDICVAEAYKIEADYSVSTAKTNKDNNLTLTEDTVLEGDIDVKNVNLNGYQLTILGNLTAHNFNGPGNAVIFGSLTVNQNLNLNEGTVYADNLIVGHNINGPGDIQYCNILHYDKNINNDPLIIQECKTSENNDDVLDDNDLNYVITTVNCDLIGTTIDGYKYIAKE